ncbi:hypothetical protein OAQ71_00005, partial [bacterium]|nr:hypothetical protein [bacterium]
MQLRSLSLVSSALFFASTAAAQSQFTFSIDWQSASMGSPSSSGVPMTDGDLYHPSTLSAMPAPGFVPAPTISLDHAVDLGLPVGCVGRGPGVPCAIEVDAFSRGTDHQFGPSLPIQRGDLLFSVDEFAAGRPGGPLPNVRSEFAAGDSSADAFGNLNTLPPGPLPPMPGRNIGMIDGDGAFSASGFTYPSIGLKEPNLPAPGPIDMGDNQDAMDVVESGTATTSAVYFSLDGGMFDGREGIPNSNAAAANGVGAADIFVQSGAGMTLWAGAPSLGLDLVAPLTDDIDALILWENGNGVADVSSGPFGWQNGRDMIIFSVRRGSAVIGRPDSLFGIPIEEGDLLIPPVAGGASPFPAIFIPAEALGLLTVRTHGVALGDDLDAADHIRGDLFDCDGDGREDAIAIALGFVPDTDRNGVPDGCSSGPVGTPFCFCPMIAAPCGNDSPTSGCINGAGTGALLTGSGTSSVALDNLVLTTSGMPTGSFAMTVMGTGTTPPAILANGLRCVGGWMHRFPPYS